jgi:hypothetical protein
LRDWIDHGDLEKERFILAGGKPLAGKMGDLGHG